MSTRPTPGSPSTSELLGGRYELLEPIAQGGMSTVYRAFDRALRRPVAVKVIRHDPATGVDREHLRERFRREAANAARIPPHPNVVQIYDYGSDPNGDRDFIVMELLRGQDLKAALRERRFSTAEAVRVILEAAHGLAAGHRVGIIHRDVKPANLLLSGGEQEGAVRILDFGIAKALEGDPDDDLTRVGQLPHTPAYAPPEQWAGRPLSPASDVYQLGLVSYELFTGERPFDANQRERLAGGEALPVPIRGSWRQVPVPLRTVVERALLIDPAARYPDAAAFAAALGTAWDGDQTLVVPDLDDGTVVAPPPSDETALLQPPTESPSDEHGGAAAVPPSWKSMPRGVLLGLASAIGALLLWGVLGDPAGPSAGEIGAAASASELEEDFAPLYQQAAERVAEEP